MGRGGASRPSSFKSGRELHEKYHSIYSETTAVYDPHGSGHHFPHLRWAGTDARRRHLPYDSAGPACECESGTTGGAAGVLRLNDPFLLRYVRWLGELLHGNFGYSITSGVPIKDILLQLFPATLELSLAALAISSVLGSILGHPQCAEEGSIGDNVLTVFGMIGVSIPQFFFGMLCILVFALDWAILPIGGRMAPGETGIWNHFKYLILPASVLGISLTAGVMRYSRSSMLDTMNKDYIKTARAKVCRSGGST